MLTYERNVLHAKVNSFLGSTLLFSVAMWAIVIICEATWGFNPVVQAFTIEMVQETQSY